MIISNFWMSLSSGLAAHMMLSFGGNPGINNKIATQKIPTVNGWFLGDSGYPLRHKLMIPILSPNISSEKWYNIAFLKTRKTIKCTFGIWKSRWRSMDKRVYAMALIGFAELLLLQ